MSLSEAREKLLRAAKEYSANEFGGWKQALLEAAVEYQQARMALASGLVTAQRTDVRVSAALRPSVCKLCGGPILWGVFGSGKHAPIDPSTVPPAPELLNGRVHYRAPMALHPCPARGQ